MKTLYLECNMGAAGDMLTAALLELIPDKEAFLDRMNRLGLPGVQVSSEPSVKCGITGTHVSVTVDGDEEESRDVHEEIHDHDSDHHHDHDHDGDHHHNHEYDSGHHHDHDHDSDHHHDYDHDGDHHHDHDHDGDHRHDHDHDGDHHHDHEYDSDHHHDHAHDGDHHHDHEHDHPHHHHAGMHDIEHIVSHLAVSDKVRQDILEVYHLIAEAESHAHGRPVDQIHFHEVGTLDAIADVAGVCLLMEELSPQRVAVSPIHVGSGQVRCAHGILPVPAPATAYILQGIPSYGGKIKGELCTPTGAALLKHFADSFGEMPVMRVEKIGYGMGKKDFEAANCVRAMLGESEERSTDEILEMKCNLDDMTPEAIGFAQDMLWNAGALDVFTTAIGMKKNRPGIMLTCLCRREDRDQVTACMFRYTTTLGIRENVCRRAVLTRESYVKETALGPVSVKTARGYGVTREKPEYEDLARICRERGLSMEEVIRRIYE